MVDHTTDIEKASDSKETSVEVTEKREPRHNVGNVPRSKGFFGKASFLINLKYIKLLTSSPAVEYH